VFGWAAMRFGVGGVSAALLGSAFVAAYEAAAGQRPFATLPPSDSLITVQMILAVVAMPLMCIAGLLDERRLATASLAAKLHFEELLSAISASFLRFPDDEVALRTALGQVSKFCGAEYVGLLHLEGDAGDLAESVWQGPGVVNLNADAFRRKFPDAMARLRNGETVAWKGAGMIPADAAKDRRSFEELGFRIMVMLPFVAGHSVRGVLALATTHDRRVSASDLPQLRLIADVIANARTRRQAELDAQRSRQELAHLARRASLDELASALSHQLNQPLAGILAHAQASQLLIEKGAPVSPEVRDGIADIIEDCRRARDVIQRVREMVAPAQPLQMATLDPEEVVRDVAMLLASDTLIRRVTLSLEFDGDASPVRGDRVLLLQAVLNVVVNAIDAVADLPLRDRVVTVRTGSYGRDHVQIRVRDQGRGLPPGAAAQAFDPFFSTKANGLGMGLGIARSIVESHGGAIELFNDPTGVVVTINLPAVEVLA
jgi:signal transduction histidine kinase